MQRTLRAAFCCFTCFALSSQSALGADLDKLVAKKRYAELDRMLPSVNGADHDYFAGILASRKRQPLRAIALLEKVLPELKKTSSKRASETLRALANDYFEIGRYGDAADAYAELLHSYGSLFNKAQNQGFSDNWRTYNLLRNSPKQTIVGRTAFSVAITRDPIGLAEVPLEIADRKEQWIFDTGANITALPVSTAQRLGLPLSKDTASTQGGATGAEVPVRTAVIPEIHFGNTIVHNAVAIVMDDKALDIALDDKHHFQITGILGYPVLSELGSFTFSGDQLALAPVSRTSSPLCTHMYVEELTPMLVADVNGHELVFGFDSGASTDTLTAKYLHEFPKQFSSLKKMQAGRVGAGGTRLLDVYQLPKLRLRLGTADATMRNVTVNTAAVGNGLLDELYGNLGQGLVGQFRSYTVDFSQMCLCVGDAKP